MACSAASIFETTNQHYWNIAIAASERTWLSVGHLKINAPLSCKLTAHFVGLSPYFMLLTLFSFSYNYQITGPFIKYFMQIVLSLLLVLWILTMLLFTLNLMTLVNLGCKTLWILPLSHFMAIFLSSCLCIGSNTLCLKVTGSLNLIWPIVLLFLMIFFNIMDIIHLG